MAQRPLREQVAARLAALPARDAVCVAFSGGLDSVVLLDLLAHERGERTLTAVHVHHGLSPNADAWVHFCQTFCAARGIALDVERVHVDRDGGLGDEGAARAARYAVFARRPEPIVALAHHRDDQAETVLLQLLRGTGLKGLAAMGERRPLPGARVVLWRPLLDVPRAALREHAQAAGLAWVEDESNASLAYDRNFVRHDLGPRLDARFPGWRQAAARLASHAASADSLLRALAPEDTALSLDSGFDLVQRAHALRAFLAANGLPMPSAARLDEMARQLYEARDDARVRLEHGGAIVFRHRGQACIERAMAPVAGDWRMPWRGERGLELGAGRGAVRFEEAIGAGLDAARIGGVQWHFAGRQGGEKIRLEEGRPTRTLKNLLREAGVPAWRRATLPLLFADGQLAWAPGIGIAHAWRCRPDRPGLQPVWSAGLPPPSPHEAGARG